MYFDTQIPVLAPFSFSSIRLPLICIAEKDDV